MNKRDRRIDALRAQALSAGCFSTNPHTCTAIEHELRHLADLGRVSPQSRRFLLQVLHSTRALDTALGEVVRQHGMVPENSLGPRLRQLSDIPPGIAGHLPHGLRGYFNRTICRVRNRYMHEANRFPVSSREVEDLLSEIESCFSLVVR